MATSAPQRGLARAPKPTLVGTYRKPGDVNGRLHAAEQKYHLVAPATSVGQLPEGTAVALSMVQVDARDMRDGGEVYSPGNGLFAVSRSVLNRIAQAAGISWDPEHCRRIDDGSDPYYVHYRAVGHVRAFDGTEVVITGEKEMDLRPGSPQIQALEARSKSGNIDNQLRELRLHILAHAESKAKNRAIRSLGLKPAYTKAELEKPFVVAKLMWTGQSDDPALRARFAEMTAARMLGGSRALFGATAATAASAAPAPTLPALKSPPPVGSVGSDFDDYAPFDDVPGKPVIDERKSEPRPQTAAPGASGHVIPAGRSKGTPIEEAEERDLEYWIDRKASDLEAGRTKPQFVERDRELLEAMRAELQRRAGGEPPDDYGREPGEDDDDFIT